MAESWNLAPYLTVADGAAAIAFYERAFGATLVTKHLADDGKRVLHGHLDIHGATLLLSDDFPEHRGGKRNDALTYGGTPVTLHLDVPDAVAVAQRAAAHGATITMPVEPQFWGDVYGQFVDPFGLAWSVRTAKPAAAAHASAGGAAD
jgi:PhnB protein